MRPVNLSLFAALVLHGCADDGSGPEGASVTLAISSTDAMTSAGDTRAVTAAVKDADGAVVAWPSLSWGTSAPDVATVSGSGAHAEITAVGDGTATITATNGSVQGTVTVTVHRLVASVVLTSPASLVPPGSSVQLTATALDARQNVIPGLTGFTYSTSNPACVIVSPSGLATALFAFGPLPSAIITATLTRDGVTRTGLAPIVVREPSTFDHAALLLSDYELPEPVPTLGAGIAYFTIDGAQIHYKVTWSALSGPATEVHLHAPGTAAEVVDVLVDFPPGSQTKNYGVVSGSFTAADLRQRDGHPPISLESLIEMMDTRDAYVDVHTAAHPGGEIRGQIIDIIR